MPLSGGEACPGRFESGNRGPEPLNSPQKVRFAIFFYVLPSFYPFQHGLFTNRLTTPFLISFSHKHFKRGVYESGRKWTVSGGGRVPAWGATPPSEHLLAAQLSKSAAGSRET